MNERSLRQYTSDKDVEIVSHKISYDGYFKIETYDVRYRKFDGSWTPVLTREIFERGQAVAVLPYDPIQNKVVLIEQFRIGSLNDERSPWLLEAVAGIIEPNETPEDVAIRETKEEAGLEIQKLIPIGKFWISPGGTTEQVTLYCGHIDAAKADGIHGVDEEYEDIKVHAFDLDEAYAMIQTGMINNPPAIIGLQWLKLNSLLNRPTC
jgi:ADP-ribose pyrophosphatase